MKSALLVAEGDPELREICRRFLAKRGYDVQTASDGIECLEKLLRWMPMVLILDRELHWGGGDGILAWLREQRALAKVSVVLTAMVDRPDVIDPLRPPVIKLLSKPFHLNALLVSVSAAVADTRRQTKFRADRPSASAPHCVG